MQNGCQIDLGQMSAPPHFGFGFGPPDPGAFDPGKAAKYYTRSTGQHTSHIGRWVVWHKWFFGSNVGLCFVVDLQVVVTQLVWVCLNDPKWSSLILTDLQSSLLNIKSMINIELTPLLSPHLGLSCSLFHHPWKECRLLHRSRNPSDQNSSCNCHSSNIGLSFFIVKSSKKFPKQTIFYVKSVNLLHKGICIFSCAQQAFGQKKVFPLERNKIAAASPVLVPKKCYVRTNKRTEAYYYIICTLCIVRAELLALIRKLHTKWPVVRAMASNYEEFF